ncbi:MAG: TrkH family potassium uptake protein [Bacteroidales bacterium]|nr:TrkH family potassium uptake protein [Bacteroidales bacterium]
MNSRVITWYIGMSLLLVSALMAVSCAIAFFTPGDDSRVPLLYSTVITALAGSFPLIFVRRSSYRLNFKEGNCIVVLAWCFACLFGMIPFLMYGKEFTFINALFESVSGFTTTGASILNDIEALPKGLLFWRISTAWTGGVGIVTLFSMTFIPRFNKRILAGAEISNVAMQPLKGERNVLFANKMLVTYITLTIATIASLRLSGMEWFDAVTNAMSACSTCGFCVRNDSIAYYDNPAAECVLIVAMLAAGIHFGIIFLTFVKGSHKNVFKSEVTKVFLLLVGCAIAAITVDLLVRGGYSSFWGALRAASFQVASISTTTGFATKDTTLWPPMSMAVLLVCSLICGCSGSTAGGIKIDRVLLAYKAVRGKVIKATSQRVVLPVRMDGVTRSDEQVCEAFGYIFCYLIIVALGGFINIACGLDFTTGVSASVACIGNVGPGFGDVGSMSNYAGIPVLVRLSSMVEMIVGRLEIFPVLYLLRSFRG